MNKKISVIGTGNWGQVIINKFHELGTLHLIYGHSNRERLTHLNPTFTEDIDFLIRDSDAVVIATPPTTHVALALKVLEGMKDLLIEKPMALSITDAEKLVEQSKEKDAVVMVGHTLCYSKGYEELRKLPGMPFSAKAKFLKKFDQEETLNAHWNLGVHMIALAVLLGVPVERLNLEVSDHASSDERTFELTTRSSSGEIQMLLYDFLASRNEDDMLMSECKSFLEYIQRRTCPRTDVQHGFETIKILEHFSPSYKK